MTEDEAPKVSLGENFIAIAHLISQTKTETRIPFSDLVKLWELNMLWALNHKGNPGGAPDPFAGAFELEGGEDGEEIELPTADEILSGDEEESPESETEDNG